MSTRDQYQCRFASREEADDFEKEMLDRLDAPADLVVGEATPSYWTWLIEQVDARDAREQARIGKPPERGGHAPPPPAVVDREGRVHIADALVGWVEKRPDLFNGRRSRGSRHKPWRYRLAASDGSPTGDWKGGDMTREGAVKSLELAFRTAAQMTASEPGEAPDPRTGKPHNRFASPALNERDADHERFGNSDQMSDRLPVLFQRLTWSQQVQVMKLVADLARANGYDPDRDLNPSGK